ncbi:MAG: PQQ-like beta-propeller repeat protein [Chloroflexi bacterium]|nr:PQQ-like beta-propeller repeat protein [Chloroflexota bacterium]
MSSTPFPGKPEVLWRWDSDTRNPWVWISLGDTTLFISVNPRDEGDNLHGPSYVAALDAATGKERWRFETPSLPFPVEAGGGRVFFGTSGGTVYALDAGTGLLAWERQVGGLPFQVFRSGAVLVVADADPNLWSTLKVWPGRPVLNVDMARLGGRLAGLDPATGATLWEKTVGESSVLAAPAAHGLVVASSQPSGDSEVALLETTTGTARWRVDSPPVSASPLVAGGLVIVPGRTLAAYDLETGMLTWSQSPPQGATFTTPILLVDGALFVATTGGALESRSLATGRVLGAKELPKCGSLVVLDSPFFLFCGLIWHLDVGPGGEFNAQIWLAPQGAVDSAAARDGVIFLTTGIGGPNPTVLLALRP